MDSFGSMDIVVDPNSALSTSYYQPTNAVRSTLQSNQSLCRGKERGRYGRFVLYCFSSQSSSQGSTFGEIYHDFDHHVFVSSIKGIENNFTTGIYKPSGKKKEKQMIKEKEILLYSNPGKVMRKAQAAFGKKVQLRLSTRKEKKYMMWDPTKETWVHFGQMGYEDYTKHQDKERRKNYLTRTAGIEGDWKKNKYSANNLARNLLW
jgi:hypothetical protein